MKTNGDPPALPDDLESYRRKAAPVPGGSAVAPVVAIATAYERDVRTALARIKGEMLARIAEAGAPLKDSDVRISISRVVAAAGRGRTWIHLRYPNLLREIEAAQLEVLKARGERKWSRARSKRDLEKVVCELRAEMDRRVATIASQQLSDLRRRISPDVRERDAHLAEIEGLKAQLAEAERTRLDQTEIIRKLLDTNNRGVS